MFYAAMTLESLEKLNTSKVFIFPAAASLKSGICYYSNEEYLLVKKLIENSHEVFVLADSRKLEKKALLKVDDMRLEYHYITDSELDAEIKSLYTENEIDIYYGES
jgi:DeoR/GlpR family transcriptional regulator of sugar metabolism